MIIDNKNTSMKSSVADQEVIACEVSGVGLKSLIKLFRDSLYSFKRRTPVQEYMSNGMDAQVVAGNVSTKMKIELPTKLNGHRISIRDFGTGISQEDLENVFIKYGASTKRNDNSQKGGFGIGAKSGWALVDKFYVINFYQGTKSVFSADISTNDEGEFTEEDVCPTDEPNGIEINFVTNPRDAQDLFYAVLRTSFLWEVKPDIINLSDFCSEHDNAENFYKNYSNEKAKILVDNCEIYDRNKLSPFWTNNIKVYLAIGSIIYPIDSKFDEINELKELNKKIRNNDVLIIKVENGVIMPQASRENIRNDKDSMIKLKDIFSKVNQSLDSFVSSTLAEAKDMKHLINSALMIHSSFNNAPQYTAHFGDFEYIVSSEGGNGIRILSPIFALFRTKACYLRDISSAKKIPIEEHEQNQNMLRLRLDVNEVNFIYNDDDEAKYTEAKIRQTLQDTKKNIVFVFTKNQAARSMDRVKDFAKITDAQSFDEIELKREYMPTGLKKQKLKGNISMHELFYCRENYVLKKQAKDLDLSEIDEDSFFVYWELADYDAVKNRFDKESVSMMKENGFTPCFIASGNIAKVKKIENFITFEDFKKTFKETSDIKQSDFDFLSFFIDIKRSEYKSSGFSMFNPDSFDNEELRNSFAKITKCLASLADKRKERSFIDKMVTFIETQYSSFKLPHVVENIFAEEIALAKSNSVDLTALFKYMHTLTSFLRIYARDLQNERLKEDHLHHIEMIINSKYKSYKAA